jgi:putative membrane protein
MARSRNGCGSLLLKWLVSAIAVYAAASFVPGITLPSFGRAMIVAVVLGLLNAILRPILVLLTLPITILTLGLFLIVINALMLMLAGELVKNFEVAGFGAALLGSLVISVVHLIADAFIQGAAPDR